ncbi:glycosyltransferase family 2 protein [Paeniglutamicibacter cryotolerans]|uniref:Glycosyltransferase involved in cell wall biosynthesis n=1 Tax=Paeniglutamicibacter cryotolerans TaxID=670079 RepID=A0A839QK69_9MICC|nr:glycosyltransferase family 2 protein [Paeniglutamicibacter cryotolerans]MBB2995993.1 glycosyltransferase involved in cell wall biosynthesis [Paeniglutamicibacter cryotolerans]
MTEQMSGPIRSVVSSPEPALVSVVIATHNRPELLRLAIAGVMDQDYAGPIECIVVFDKTEPDQTLEVSGDRRRLRVVSNRRTPGLAGARNSGIVESAGEYVAFCDDDDIWMPTKLSVQVGLLSVGSALTAVSGIVIDYGKHSTVRVPKSDDLTLKNLVRRRVMEAHPSSVIVKRDALMGPIGLMDEDLPGSYGEDFDWILRAVQIGSIAVATEPLVRVRWGGSQFSQRWDIIIDAIDYGLEKHAVLSLDPKGHARLLGRRSFAAAAMGRRKEALHGAIQTLRLSVLERRAYLAVAVALHLVSAARLLRWAHQRGRGI